MKSAKLFLIATEDDLSLDREVICELVDSINAAEGSIAIELTVREELTSSEELKGVDLAVLLCQKELDEQLISHLEEEPCEASGRRTSAVFLKQIKGERPSKEQKGLIERLSGISGLCFFSYEDVDTLRLLFTTLLCAASGLKLICRDGKLLLNERELLSLKELPLYQKSKDLSRLLAELKEAKGVFSFTRTAYGESESDETRLALFTASKKLRELFEEKEALENAIIDFLLSIVINMTQGVASPRQRAAFSCFLKGDYNGATAAMSYDDIASDISALKNGSCEGVTPLLLELIARADLLSARGYTPERNSEIERCLSTAARYEEKLGLPPEALYRISKRRLFYGEYAEAAEAAEKLNAYYEREGTADECRYPETLIILASAERGRSRIDKCESVCRRLLEYITPKYSLNPSGFGRYLIRTLTLLCDINVEKSEIKAAIELAEILLSLLGKSYNDYGDLELRAAVTAARALTTARLYDRALSLLENAEKKINELFSANEALYAPLLIELLVTSGEVHLALFDFCQAHKLFSQASEYCSVFCRDGNFGKEDLLLRLRFGCARAIFGFSLSYSEAGFEAEFALEEAKRLFEKSPEHYAARYLLSATFFAATGISDNVKSEQILKEAYIKTLPLFRDTSFDRIAEAFALKVLAALETKREASVKTYFEGWRSLNIDDNQIGLYYPEAQLIFEFERLKDKKDKKNILALETAIKRYGEATEQLEKLSGGSCYFKAGFNIIVAGMWREAGETKRAERIVTEAYETLKLSDNSAAVDTAFKKTACIKLYREWCALYLLDGDLEAAKHCSDICIKTQRQLLDKRAPFAGVTETARLYLTRANDIEDLPDEQERFYKLAEAVLINFAEVKGNGQIPLGSLEEKVRALFCEVEESFGGFLSREGRGGEAIEKYKRGLKCAELLIKKGLYRGYVRAACIYVSLSKRHIAEGEYQNAEAALRIALQYQLDPASLGEENRLSRAAETLRIYSELAELKSKLGFREEAASLFNEAVEFTKKEESETARYLKEKGLMYLSFAEHIARYGDNRSEINANRKLARTAFAQAVKLAKERTQREELRDILFDLDHPIGE